MKAVRLYFRFFEMQLKSMMQHKASFFFTMLGQFLVSFNVFLGVYFMMTVFMRFPASTIRRFSCVFPSR